MNPDIVFPDWDSKQLEQQIVRPTSSNRPGLAPFSFRFNQLKHQPNFVMQGNPIKDDDDDDALIDILSYIVKS